MRTKQLLIAGVVLLAGIVALIYFSSVEKRPSDVQQPAAIDPAKAAFIDEICSDIQIGEATSSPFFAHIGEPLETGIPSFPSLSWTTKVLNVDEPRESVHAEYPEFAGGQPVAELNEHVRFLINDQVEHSKRVVDDNADPHGYPPPQGKCDDGVCLSTTYKIADVVNGIVSFELIFTDFTGGGNGNHNSSVVVNWDLKKNEEVSSDGLFCKGKYYDVLAPIVRKQIVVNENQCRADTDTLRDLRGWVYDGVNSKENWMFLLDKQGITPVFDPYRVASGAAGIIYARISLSALPKDTLCLP